MRRTIPLALMLIFSHAPVAWGHEEPVAAEKGPWSGHVGLGYTAVTGNTETDDRSDSDQCDVG
jgi:putative salt-induced outer membrane protein YdiY